MSLPRVWLEPPPPRSGAERAVASFFELPEGKRRQIRMWFDGTNPFRFTSMRPRGTAWWVLGGRHAWTDFLPILTDWQTAQAVWTRRAVIEDAHRERLAERESILGPEIRSLQMRILALGLPPTNEFSPCLILAFGETWGPIPRINVLDQAPSTLKAHACPDCYMVLEEAHIARPGQRPYWYSGCESFHQDSEAPTLRIVCEFTWHNI